MYKMFILLLKTRVFACSCLCGSASGWVGEWVGDVHVDLMCKFDTIRIGTLNNQCLWMNDKSYRICIEY